MAADKGITKECVIVMNVSTVSGLIQTEMDSKCLILRLLSIGRLSSLLVYYRQKKLNHKFNDRQGI